MSCFVRTVEVEGSICRRYDQVKGRKGSDSEKKQVEIANQVIAYFAGCSSISSSKIPAASAT